MAVIHWVGGSSTHFNDPNNWNPPGLPNSTSDVIIGAGFTIDSPATITINSLALAATSSLTINAATGFTVNTGTNGAGIAGTLNVANSAVMSIGGTIVNSGTINESSTGTTTEIVLTQTTNTLTGGGKVVLSANTNNLIFATTSTFLLDNQDNTISGGGNIGNGSMVLSNEGIINANQSTATLTINTGGNVITNSGTMEATNGGDLNIVSAVNNVGGTIEAVGAGSVVVLQGNVTGGTVTTSGGGVIQTSGASGVLDGLGLHPVTNASAIQVLNGQQLTLLGTIINNSSISLNATANATNLRIGSPTVTLKGTGAIHLTNNANNQIFGTTAAYKLVNLTNTIDGAGLLGANSLTFSNAGTVNANQPGSLTLNTGANLAINTGVMESSNTGGLVILNTAVDNAGGTIQALVAGSHVDLSGGTIQGGTLKTANGGVIETISGNGGLDGITYGVLNNTGTFVVKDQTILSLAGTINNTGLISESQTSGSGNTQIRISNQNVTLKGGGKLTMSNSALNLIVGTSSSNTLTNVDNTISGAGAIGGGANMFLVNQTKGIINANQSTALTVRTDADIVTNAGTMEGTSTGGLVLWNTAFNNAGGTIEAVGAGAHVDLQTAYIEGGTLTTSGGGVIKTVDTGSTLDGITSGILNNKGTLQVNDQNHLGLVGVINNTGLISENQTSNTGSTQIRIASQNVTLQGGGKLTMSNNSLNQIFGNAGSDTLVNVDNTISGAGAIGGGANMFLVNQTKGVINANQSIALTVGTGGNTITNAGTMVDTSTGGLLLSSTTVNNAGGTIEALGAGTHVDLASATIEGGTLTTATGGVIKTTDTGSVLDGIASGVVTNSGTIQIVDSTRLGLVGVISNTGTINAASSGGATALRIIGNTTLQGAGKVVMSDNVNNQIFGNSAGFQFANVDNTISGAGAIGVGASMILVNQTKGVINANAFNALTVGTGANIITNAGTMEATSTVASNGGLVISSTTVNNAGGTIEALGALAHVNLVSANIEGGKLTTTGKGVIQTEDTGSTLDGLTSGVLTNSGTVLVLDHTALSLVGTISNAGTIFEDATSVSGDTTVHIAGQSATLSGAGQLLLSDNANNVVSGSQLINAGNLISGAGRFGNGGMDFDNKTGTLRGTGTNTLVINLGQGNLLNEAAANIAATGAGGVTMNQGIFTNKGTMTANDGSSLIYQSGALNTNLAAGALIGGTWRAVAAGHGATLTLSSSAAGGGVVATDAAVVVLSGSGSLIQSFDPTSGTIKTLEQTLSSVATGGQLQVLANRGYTSTLDFADSGIVQLGGGTFQTNSLSVAAAGLLNGFGTVNDAVANAGKIEAKGGLLTVTGNITGAGALQIDASSTLEVGGSSSETATFTGVGKLELDLPTAFTGPIAGLVLNDVIDLGGVTDVTKTAVVGSTLTVTRSGHPNLTYTVSGTGLAGNHFAFASDGAGGTNLTLVAGPGAAQVVPLGSSGGGSGSGGFINLGGSDPAWVGGSGNSFNTAANWNPTTVPVAGSDAVITLAGAAVVSSVSNTVATLAMGTTDSLELAGTSNTFTVTNGSGIGDLKGTITVDNSNVLVLAGTIVNSGQIKLGSTGNNTDLRIGSAIVDLQGTGAIHLSNNGSNRIFSNSANFQLINETNTIDGAGQLGAASLTFTNKKLVNANQTTALTLNTQNNIVVNTGTMQSSASGGLVIQNTTVNNAGGTIQALVAKSHVDLAGGTIEGGTLATAAGGVIQTVGGGALDGITAGVLNNKGTLLVNDQTTLSLLGVINNTGTIAENQLSSGGSTNIHIASQNVTLQGGGKLTMTNNSLNQLFGTNAAFTLTNVDNTISGAGAIGGGASMFLVNQAKGVINANQAPTFFQSGQLVINTGANLLVNNGTLESTSTGGLEIVNTAVNNAGAIDTDGTVLAAGAGAHVDLNGATIMGGVLATSGGGVIQTVANSGLDGITFGALKNTGTMLVADQTRLDLAGTINNTGSILVDQESTTLSTTLQAISQNVTLQGGGQVAMSNNSLNQIIGAGSNVLVNVDNTVSGAGTIGGSANMVLVNQTKGIINANQTTALIVRTDANIITNTGTMEGTGTGGLVLWNTTFNNAGGTIEAVGAGALVDLQSAYIEGGTLTTSGGGIIQTVDRASTLDGITAGTLSNSGLIQLNDNTLLSLVGVINNTGTISEAASSKGSSSTVLRLVGDTTLQGGGNVVMSNNASNQIFGNSGAFHLTNVDNTIAGAGLIGGSANMILVNQTKGIINANQKTSLTVRTDANIITNAGTMESTGTAALNGGLVLWNTAINNAGGTIQAVGAQANVDLQSVYIEGGTLTTSGGGVIQTVDAASTLDGITSGVLTNSGTVLVNDSMMLSLTGTIANSGTIMENGFGNTGNTRLKLTGPVTLTGAGQVLLSDNANNQMFASTNLFMLTNQGNLISGAGQFGAGGMDYDNKSGTIRGTGTNNALVINLGQGTGLNEATGNIAATGAGGVILTSGYFTNNGVMAANNGSAITFQSGAVNVNLAEGDLVGGTWRAVSTGLGATFTVSGSAAGGGAVVNDGALIVLQGAGSVIQSFDPTSGTIKPLEQTMASVASGGQLQVLANRGYISGLNFTDSGIVQLGGGTFQTSSLSVTSGAKFFGFGTVQDSVANAGLIEVNSGTLTVTGSISGAGTLQADAGTTLVLTGPSIQAAKITDNGTVNLGGGIVQATTMTVAAGSKLIGFGTIQNAVANSGLIEASGGILTVTGSIIGAGTLQSDIAATLALSGASSLASKVIDNGTVQLGGGTLKATTLTVASGATLSGFGTVQNAVANSGLIEANGGTLTVTGAITGTGTLQADIGATLALNGASNLASKMTDNGTVQLGGGTLNATTLTVASGANLSGLGTVQNAVSNAGTIEATSGTLTVTGSITGAGALQADSGATLSLTGTTGTATTVTNNGTVSLGVGDNLDVTGSVNAASTGVFLLNNSSVLEVAVDKGTSNKMSFIGTGQLSVDAVAQFGNNVGLGTYTGPLLENFGVGDVVQLKDLNFAGASIVSYTAATGLLQLANGATKATLLFQNSSLGAGSFFIGNVGGDVAVTHHT